MKKFFEHGSARLATLVLAMMVIVGVATAQYYNYGGVRIYDPYTAMNAAIRNQNQRIDSLESKLSAESKERRTLQIKVDRLEAQIKKTPIRP